MHICNWEKSIILCTFWSLWNVPFSSNLVSSFWRENSNLVKITKDSLTFEKYLPLQGVVDENTYFQIFHICSHSVFKDQDIVTFSSFRRQKKSKKWCSQQEGKLFSANPGLCWMTPEPNPPDLLMMRSATLFHQPTNNKQVARLFLRAVSS